MNKILTISIAAYNSEKYIRKALDSLTNDEVIDDLEIFVIDDGGTDATLDIAREYASEYPKSVKPIHKENGGYGSTVNYSVAHASGKYFKLLDGDDWYETPELIRFVRALKELEADVIITPYYHCTIDGKKWKSGSVDKYKQDVDIQISEMDVSYVFGMWGLTYKTDVLKKCGMELPSHCLYTDQIYSTVPFSTANTVRFLNLCVYCYLIGREGQSVSKDSKIRHIGDNLKLIDILCEFYEDQKKKNCPNIEYILRRIVKYARYVIKSYLLVPVTPVVLQNISAFDKKLKRISPDVYRLLGNIYIYKGSALYICMLRLTGYGKIGFILSKIVLPSDGIKNLD